MLLDATQARASPKAHNGAEAAAWMPDPNGRQARRPSRVELATRLVARALQAAPRLPCICHAGLCKLST